VDTKFQATCEMPDEAVDLMREWLDEGWMRMAVTVEAAGKHSSPTRVDAKPVDRTRLARVQRGSEYAADVGRRGPWPMTTRAPAHTTIQ